MGTEDFIEKYVDQVVDGLVDRTLKVWGLHGAALDKTTFVKTEPSRSHRSSYISRILPVSRSLFPVYRSPTRTPRSLFPALLSSFPAPRSLVISHVSNTHGEQHLLFDSASHSEQVQRLSLLEDLVAQLEEAAREPNRSKAPGKIHALTATAAARAEAEAAFAAKRAEVAAEVAARASEAAEAAGAAATATARAKAAAAATAIAEKIQAAAARIQPVTVEAVRSKARKSKDQSPAVAAGKQETFTEEVPIDKEVEKIRAAVQGTARCASAAAASAEAATAAAAAVAKRLEAAASSQQQHLQELWELGVLGHREPWELGVLGTLRHKNSPAKTTPATELKQAHREPRRNGSPGPRTAPKIVSPGPPVMQAQQQQDKKKEKAEQVDVGRRAEGPHSLPINRLRLHFANMSMENSPELDASTVQAFTIARWVYWDTETTGLFGSVDGFSMSPGIVTVGWTSDGDTSIQGQALVLPTREIEEQAAKVHGYTREKLKKEGAGTLHDGLAKFFQDVERLAPAPVVLAAHNSWHFDARVLRAEMATAGVELPSNVIGFYDTLPWVRQVFPDARSPSGMRSHKLTSLCQLLNIPDEREVHGALADSQLLKAVVEQLEAKKGPRRCTERFFESTAQWLHRTAPILEDGASLWEGIGEQMRIMKLTDAFSQIPSPERSSRYALIRGQDTDGSLRCVMMERGVFDTVRRKTVYNGEVGDWQLDDPKFMETFKLPDEKNKFDVLSSRYPFPRDKRIVFYQDTHTYKIDGSIVAPRSVTELVEQFEEPFEPSKMVVKMRKARSWPHKVKEYTWPNGTLMTNAEIKKKWKDNGKLASARGTLLHWQVEMFMNGAIIYGPFCKEFGYFIDFYERFMLPRNLVPVRTEFSVFHTGLSVAGQIDLLAKYRDTDKYVIFDYKRSNIKPFNLFQQLHPPFEHLDSCNLNKYTLQMLLYRYILQTEYSLVVDELYLVVLHESQEAANIIKLPFWEEEVERLVEYERNLRNARVPNADADAPFEIEHLQNLEVHEQKQLPLGHD